MIEFVIFLVLIFLTGFFVISEISLVSARKSKLEAQAAKGDLKAKEALALANNPEKFLSTATIGITILSILMGVFAEDKFSEKLEPLLLNAGMVHKFAGPLASVIAIVFVTFVTIIFGELLPKKLGLLKSEKIAKALVVPVNTISTIFYPLVWLLSSITNGILNVLNIKKPTDSAVTEEEIKALISEGSESGSIEEDEKDIIERVFHLGDRNITSLMTHRTDIVWYKNTDTVDTVKSKSQDIIYSVFPICENTVDNIKGTIHIKDLLKAKDTDSLETISKPALFVPENNTAYQLLEKFKATKIHAAFIVNEYGTLEGMVTLNDILEAIIGDVPQTGQEDYEIVKRQDGSYLVDAQIQFYDFLSYFEKADWMNEGEQEFDTLAGFALHEFEHIPTTGETFTWKDFSFEIIDMDGQRIDKILVTISEELKEILEEEE
jgi:putative hemolysin